MDILYFIETDFDCAFLINGVFREKSGLISYPSDSPIYITVLPLNAVLLPYTIKVVGGNVMCNENLADCYKATADKYIIILKQRHNYVYSPHSPVHCTREKGYAYDFFDCVKRGDAGAARAMLSPSLASTIDDRSLLAFFASFTDIIPNPFPTLKADYLLSTKEKKCEAFNITLSGNLIDNIEEAPIV